MLNEVVQEEPSKSLDECGAWPQPGPGAGVRPGYNPVFPEMHVISRAVGGCGRIFAALLWSEFSIINFATRNFDNKLGELGWISGAFRLFGHRELYVDGSYNPYGRHKLHM
jgi:hypothetical protein